MTPPRPPSSVPQVLRPLAEVALASDLLTLHSMWLSFLPVIDSLPCWVCASTLLLVLQRADTLRSTPPCETLVRAEAAAAATTPDEAPAAASAAAAAAAAQHAADVTAVAVTAADVTATPVDGNGAAARAACTGGGGGGGGGAVAARPACLSERVCNLLPEIIGPVAHLVQHATSDKV